MDIILSFIQNNLNINLLIIIVLGGVFVTKYSKGVTGIKDAYKVLLASIFFSVIFYIIQDCKTECLPQYLFTYLFATSFYELIVKFILNKITGIFKSTNIISKVGGELPKSDDNEKGV